MTAEESCPPFQPTPRDFAGFTMPASVPKGLRLELSRSRILRGAEGAFDDWMRMLGNRYDECIAATAAERAVFEATFRHTEADGSTWIYHLSLVGDESGGLDEATSIGADHAAFARSTKESGWQELEPRFMLAPAHILQAMTQWGRTGSA